MIPKALLFSLITFWLPMSFAFKWVMA